MHFAAPWILSASLLLSGAIAFTPDRARRLAPQDPAPRPPALAANVAAIELGRCFDDAQTEFKLRLRNVTGDVVPVRKVRGSCGCIRTGAVPASVAPREEVEVTFWIRLQSYVGKFEKAVFVHYGEPDARPLRIPVTGEITYRLVVEPRVALVKRNDANAPATTDVVVTSGSGDSLSDLNAVASEPGVVVTREASGAAVRLRITVPPEVKNLHGLLTIRLGKYERVVLLTDGSPAPVFTRNDGRGRLPAEARRVGAGTLAVAFTGQDHGELEPCGCTQGMLGGLSRRPARLRAFVEPGLPLLTVSGGDLTDGAEDLDRLRLQTLLTALSTMGYHALAPSRRDLAVLAALSTLTPPVASPPMVAVDIDESSVGDRNLQRMLRIETEPVASYITGITGPPDGPAVGSLKFTEQVQALRDLRGELPVFAPLVVLANIDQNKARELARYMGRPTLILYASPFTDPGLEDVEEGPVALAPMPTTGKYVGLARFYGTGGDGTWSIEFRPVDADLPEDQAVVLQRRQHQQRMREAELVARAARNPRFTPHAISGEPVPKQVGGGFVGDASCIGCHPGAAKVWSESRHAKALATLHAAGSDGDPGCVACHVVGYGQTGGFVSEVDTNHLANVGCEACHGPRANHVAHRSRAPTNAEPGPLAPLARSSCAACHDSKHDPKFDFDAYWQRIAHGAK